MTKYKEIIGTDIEVVTTDPTTTGQVWYNESEGELKTRNQFVGNAWSSGGSLNTARKLPSASVSGTQTASLAFGGEVPPNNFQNITESWNGTNWSNVASMNTDRAYFGGVGTGTAGLAFGGQQSTADTAATEE